VATDCLDEDFALALVEQRIDDDARRSALRHAARCEDCRRLLAALVRAIPTTTGSGSHEPVESIDLIELGTSLGPYVVEGWIGRGGVGVVYVGRDARLDRKVALKLLARTDPDAGATRRFVREARILAQLSHPHIVGVHDVGRSAHGLWIAMELVDGATLDAWTNAAARTPAEILAVFRQAAAGLAAAHAAGIVHRDFKPHNVMVGRDGRVRVLDFGLAAAVEPSSNPDDEGGTPEGRTGVVGTPTYMAPEQFAGLPADARSDQFSFCVALWEALVGARPFAADSFHALALEVSGGRVVDPGRRMPARIEAVLRRGLAVDPAERFASMAELSHALDRAQKRAGRPARIAAASMLAIGVVALAVVERPVEPCERGARRVTDSVHEAAAALSAAIASSLDERADAWASAFVATCTADRASASVETAAKLACLADRRAELESIVEVLEPEQRGAEAMLGSLTPLSACDDRDLHAESALPADPELARRVVSLRQRLATAKARAEVRLDDGFRATFSGFVEEADAIGWMPLRTRTREAYGSVLAHYFMHAEAIPVLESAYFLAKENGETAVELDAAIMLVSCVGNRLGRHEAALAWARHAEAALEELDDPARASKLYKLRGELYQEMHRYEEAETDLRTALVLLPADVRPYEHATALSMLGNLLAELWRCDEGAPLFEQALALDPPPFAALQAYNGIVVCHIQAEDYEQGIAAAERALALADASGEPEDTRAQLLHNIALLYGENGATRVAIAKLEDAHAMSVALWGPHAEEVRPVAFNLARYHLIEGEYDRARWWAERVLEAGPGEPPTIQMHLQGAWALEESHRRAGRIREAIVAWEDRIAVREREGDVAALADDLDELADLCDQAGRAADAEAARQRAVMLRATLPDAPESDAGS